ncbi:hypothetical protein ACFQE1_05580 [Halobium palmae]|uniref:Uncharacterized protein n=1 Tax=Halobium palmae TaxID=1776492 RepID=A0ABD5RWP0_9EURY
MIDALAKDLHADRDENMFIVPELLRFGVSRRHINLNRDDESTGLTETNARNSVSQTVATIPIPPDIDAGDRSLTTMSVGN